MSLNDLPLMVSLRMGHAQSPLSYLCLFADVLEVKKVGLKRRTIEKKASQLRNKNFLPAFSRLFYAFRKLHYQ